MVVAASICAVPLYNTAWCGKVGGMTNPEATTGNYILTYVSLDPDQRDQADTFETELDRDVAALNALRRGLVVRYRLANPQH